MVPESPKMYLLELQNVLVQIAKKNYVVYFDYIGKKLTPSSLVFNGFIEYST